MNSCLKSLCSLVIALGLGVFATGCIAETETDADTFEAMPGSETQDAGGTTDEASPDEDESSTTDDEEPPPDPPQDPSGLCTSSSCVQV